MVTFRLEGTAALQATLAKLGAEAPVAAGSALYMEALAILAKSKQYVPVDMGVLRASGTVGEPEGPLNGRMTVRIGYGGPAERYALYVHEGIGPAVGRPVFFPPIAAILPWMKRHGIPESAAYVVARAIGRRGIKPTKFLSRALDEARPGLENRLRQRVENWMVRYGVAG